MKRLTFIKSLFVLPFISSCGFAISTEKDNRSEFDKCYDRISGAALSNGLTSKETLWFCHELLRVESDGALAGNFGKSFIIRFFQYLKGSQIDRRERGFVYQMTLLAVLRVNFPEMFSDKEIEKFCGVFYHAKLDRLLKNINTVKGSSLWAEGVSFVVPSKGEKYLSITPYEN